MNNENAQHPHPSKRVTVATGATGTAGATSVAVATGAAGAAGVTGVIALIVRVAVAVVFLYAGYTKAGDPADFAQAIDRYRVIPHALSVITALFLPWLEITCGIALFFKMLRAGAAALLTACGAVFVVMIASALARGLDISCGCFGGDGDAAGHASLVLSLARAFVLAAACAWLLARETGRCARGRV